MNEFIKIKNGTGKGDLVLRAKFVLKATDADDGTATITYGDNFPDAWQIKTTSTAAEVLAAIEGAQQSAPIVHRQGGPLAMWVHPPAGSLAEHYYPLRPDMIKEKLVTSVDLGREGADTGRLSPNSLALISLGNQLATELENQSGFKWDVLIHGATDTDARFRCQPQGGEWWCSTAIFSREGLGDESGHGLAKRVYDMAADVFANWRTLGAR